VITAGSHTAPALHERGATARIGRPHMSDPHSGDYRIYWDAIQRRACAVCLDAADDGTCGLPRGRTCALPAQLPAIVSAKSCG